MTYQDELFTFPNAKPTTQPLTAAKKTLSFNEQLISDYTAVDGSVFDVGNDGRSLVLSDLYDAPLTLNYKVKYTGTNHNRPFLDIEKDHRRTLHNLLTEVFIIGLLDEADTLDDTFQNDIWSIMHTTASTVNRRGAKQTWQTMVKGLLNDKIMYKKRNYHGKTHRHNDDFSYDQLRNIHNLFSSICLALGVNGVNFVEVQK